MKARPDPPAVESSSRISDEADRARQKAMGCESKTPPPAPSMPHIQLLEESRTRQLQYQRSPLNTDILILNICLHVGWLAGA